MKDFDDSTSEFPAEKDKSRAERRARDRKAKTRRNERQEYVKPSPADKPYNRREEKKNLLVILEDDED